MEYNVDFDVYQMFACAIFTHVFVWPDLKISEREKTLWASRGEHSVEINISREKEFIQLLNYYLNLLDFNVDFDFNL